MKVKSKKPLSIFLVLAMIFAMLPFSAIAQDSSSTATVTIDVTYKQTIARSMLSMVNELRTGDDAWYWAADDTTVVSASDLSELTYDYALEAVAMQRAAELALSYSHTRTNGAKSKTACSDAGYSYSVYGENIAWSYGYSEDAVTETAFEGWEEADEDYSGQGHRRNMLSGNFTSIGIACVYYNDYYYWAMELATPQSSGSTVATSANNSETSVDVDILLSDATITVTPSETSISLTEGDTVTLPEVTTEVQMTNSVPAKAKTVSADVSWSVADSECATISGDTLTGVAAGSTTLTVTALGTTAEVAVTVVDEKEKTTTTASETTTIAGETTTTTAGSTVVDEGETTTTVATITSTTAPITSAPTTITTTSTATPTTSAPTTITTTETTTTTTAALTTPTTTTSETTSDDDDGVLDKGTCGDDLTWVLTSDGVLTISGTGNMYAYDWGDAPWYDYRSSVTSVVIEDGATSIGDYAFYYCYNLTSVTIPDSVKSIGDYAFRSCYNLTSITIPDSVETIGDYAFYYCYNLKSITIPDSVETIGNYAFKWCEALTSVTIGNSVETIGDGAFRGCESLTSVVIPNSVTSIDYGAFNGCESLETADIGDGVTSIGDHAFYNCTALTSVEIGSGLEDIGTDIFWGCSLLAAINVSDDNESFSSVDGVLFSKDGTELIVYPTGKTDTQYTVPDGVTSIDSWAFFVTNFYDGKDDTGAPTVYLESVVIPASVTTIGEYALSSDIVIYGYKGSAAETYASSNGNKFVDLTTTTTTTTTAAPTSTTTTTTATPTSTTTTTTTTATPTSTTTTTAAPVTTTTSAPTTVKTTTTATTPTTSAPTTVTTTATTTTTTTAAKTTVTTTTTTTTTTAPTSTTTTTTAPTTTTTTTTATPTTTTTTATPTTTTTTAAKTTTTTTSNKDDDSDTTTVTVGVTYQQSMARDMLSLVNELRTGDDAWYWNSDNTAVVSVPNLSELTYDYDLEAIAMQRAAEIVVSFSHTRPDGTSWVTAYDGYSWTWIGENIAYGYTSAQDAFDAWLEADEDYSGQGHRRNMLAEKATSIGIACVYYNGEYYWVMELASSDNQSSYVAANDDLTDVSVKVPTTTTTTTTAAASPTTTTTTTVSGSLYKILVDGTDGEYTLTSGGTVSIHCSGELSRFLSVYVDGKLVDSSNYVLTDGSTIVTFTNDYLETLAAGDHTVTLNFTDGSATATLTVIEASSGNGDDSSAATTTTASGETTTTTTATTSDSPATGDDFSAAPLVCLVFFSLIAGAVALSFERRRFYNFD